jgi:hypothetical protein
MRFFNMFGSDRVGALWEYQAESFLWHVRPTESDVVICEERDTDRKTVLYTAIDRESGAVLWHKPLNDGSWWTGIETVHDGILFLHGFASPDMPHHRGIRAFDLRTGAGLWSKLELRYVAVSGRTLFAAELTETGERVLAYDVRSGERVPDDVAELPTELADEAAGEYLFPSPLATLLQHQPAAASLVRARCAGLNLVEESSALVLGAHVVAAYHERLAPEPEPWYRTTMMVLDSHQGKLQYQRVLDGPVRRVSPEPFFAHRSMVFGIERRSILFAVQLAQPL